MNVDYLIQLLGNRFNSLGIAKEQAFLTGDLDRINSLDVEINGVLDTINKLKLLEGISQTAAITPFTEAQVVQNGIEASFNPTIINDATKSLLVYNIAPYATDPYHEIKIQNILEKMGAMDSPESIEIYIKKTNPDSPLNGLMVYNSSNKYQVDSRLMLALMELDSRFGTIGVGARTYNPGNIGNTGEQESSYSSWDEGVDAVAAWLNRHRISKVELKEDKILTPETPVVKNEIIQKIEEKPIIESQVPVQNPEVVTEPVVEETPVVIPEVVVPDISSESPVIEEIPAPEPVTVSVRQKRNQA